jgi:hypothetical protein
MPVHRGACAVRDRMSPIAGIGVWIRHAGTLGVVRVHAGNVTDRRRVP